MKYLLIAAASAAMLAAMPTPNSQTKGMELGVLDCKVLTLEPNRTLAYSWNFAHDDPAFNLKSVVTFTLTPTAAGTHLRMEQAGFRPDQKQATGGARHGWAQMFDKLETVLGAEG